MSCSRKHNSCSSGEASHGIDTPEHLTEHLAEFVSPSMVIVCVGNELCGDDGAGVVIARRLAGKVPWDVCDAQGVPESFLMKIVNSRPETVVLIDALDFAAVPGAVELVEASSIGGQGPSTHGPAPVAFLEILRMMHTCRCVVLGIQPEQCEWGKGLSEAMKGGIELVVKAFERLASMKDTK